MMYSEIKTQNSEINSSSKKQTIKHWFKAEKKKNYCNID